MKVLNLPSYILSIVNGLNTISSFGNFESIAGEICISLRQLEIVDIAYLSFTVTNLFFS